MKRRLPVTVDTVEKEPHTDQNEPPKKKKKKKNPHKKEHSTTTDEDQSNTTKVTSLPDSAESEGHNREQKKKKKKDKKKQHEVREQQKSTDKEVVSENNREEVTKEGEEDMEDGEAGNINESHVDVDDWTKEQCLLLINNIKQSLPEKDVMMFKTRALHLPWKEIIVNPFTEEQCQAKYKELTKRVRHYRTLEEILQDVEKDLNNPKQKLKKAQDVLNIKKPLSVYLRFVKDKMGSMTTQKSTEKFKILAAEYKELSEEKKQKYVDVYNEEKKVYDEEIAKLRHSHPELFSSSAKKSSKTSTTTKISKMPTLKYIEAVDLYVESQIEKKKEENPQCDVKTTEEKYRKRWESLNETKKEKWVKKADTMNKNEFEKLQEENPERTFTKSQKKVMERLQGKPDKPLSAYNLFTIENLSKMTGIPNNERMKEVGQRWRVLSEEEREAYNEKARQAKIEYDRKYKEFLDRLTPEEREKETAAKTPKKKKRLQGPMSAMMFFINEKKEEYGSKHPTMDDKEIGRYLYLEFKNLSEEQKAKYTAMEEAQYAENTNQTKITKYFSSSFCSSADDEQSTTKIAPVNSRLDSLTTTINLMSDSSEDEELGHDKTISKEKKKKKTLSLGKDKSSTKPNSNLVTSTPLTKSKKLTPKQVDVFELKSDSSSDSDNQKSLQNAKKEKGKKIQNTNPRKSAESSSSDDSDSESDASPDRSGQNKQASQLNAKSKTKPKQDISSSESDSESDSEEEKTDNKKVNSKRQSPQKVLPGKKEPTVNNQSSDSESSSSDEEVAKSVKTVQSPRKLPSPVKPVKDVSESSSSSESDSSDDEEVVVAEKKTSPNKVGTEKRASPVKTVTGKNMMEKLSQVPAKGNKPSVSKKLEMVPQQGGSSSDSSDSSDSSSEEENVEVKDTGNKSLNKVTNSVKPGKTNQSKSSQVQASKSKSPVTLGKSRQSLDRSIPSASSSTKGSGGDKLSQDLFSGSGSSDSEDSDSSSEEEEKKETEKKTVTKSLPPAKPPLSGNVKTNSKSKKESSDDSSDNSSDSDASTSSDDSD